jgi:hypothetical protein
MRMRAGRGRAVLWQSGSGQGVAAGLLLARLLPGRRPDKGVPVLHASAPSGRAGKGNRDADDCDDATLVS